MNPLRHWLQKRRAEQWSDEGSIERWAWTSWRKPVAIAVLVIGGALYVLGTISNALRD